MDRPGFGGRMPRGRAWLPKKAHHDLIPQVFRLLSFLHRTWERDPHFGCDNHFHPSIDWNEYYDLVSAYAYEEFDEGKIETIATETLTHAAGYSDGVVWKHASAAVYKGKTISEYTKVCPLGILCAFILRFTTLALGDLDVYKILESALVNIQKVPG